MAVTIIDSLQRGGTNTSPFALTHEENVSTSYVTLGTIAERDLIPTWKRRPYMRCHIIADGKDYRLGADVSLGGQVWTEIAGNPLVGDYQLLSEKNQPSGYVGLTAAGKIDPSFIDSIYSNNSFVVADQTARLNTASVTGDIIVQLDTSEIYVKLNNTTPPAAVGDFAELVFPGAVLSVNGQVGVVVVSIASLLLDAQNQIDFDARVSGNSTVTSNAGQISTNVADILALQSSVVALQGNTTVIIAQYEDDPNRSFVVGEPIIYTQFGVKQLYYCIQNSPGNIIPIDTNYFEKVGDYYTVAEINLLLTLKADLVNGVIPVNQLPPEVFTQTIVVEDITARNNYTPLVTGLRFLVIDATLDPNIASGGAEYVYSPASPSADVTGFVIVDVSSIGGWPLAGNFSTIGTQVIALGGDLTFSQPGGNNSVFYEQSSASNHRFTIDMTNDGASTRGYFIVHSSSPFITMGTIAQNVTMDNVSGLANGGDYSATATARSLIDLAHIQSLISASGSPNFGAASIKTISVGVAASGINRNLLLAAESGTVDSILELTGLTIGDEVWLRADTGDTITVVNDHIAATVKILLREGIDLVLDEDHPLKLVLLNATQLVQLDDDSPPPNFRVSSFVVINTGVITAGSTKKHIRAGAQTGVIDDLIEIVGLTIGDEIILRAAAGDTITVKHNDAGATIKILLTGDADLVLDEKNPLVLVLVDTNELAQVDPGVTSSGGGGPAFKTWYVDPTFGGTSDGSAVSPFTVLQTTIDNQASSGDTIYVTGTITEAIIVNKGINLVGINLGVINGTLGIETSCGLKNLEVSGAATTNITTAILQLQNVVFQSTFTSHALSTLIGNIVYFNGVTVFGNASLSVVKCAVAASIIGAGSVELYHAAFEQDFDINSKSAILVNSNIAGDALDTGAAGTIDLQNSTVTGTNNVNTIVDDHAASSLTPNFGAGVIKTIAVGVLAAGTDKHLIAAAENTTTDDLIEITGLTIGDEILLYGDTGDTIIVKHNDAGATIKILLQDTVDFILDTLHPLKLILTTATTLVQSFDEVTIAGHIIENDGTPLTQRGTVNFTGSGVSSADTGGKTVVTIIDTPASPLADYATTAAMILGQSNQIIGNLYYTTDTESYWVLVAKTADASDYRGGGLIEDIVTIWCSDFITSIATGTKKGYWTAPFACTLQSAFGSVSEESPTGGSIILDVNKNGTTMMSTNKIVIEATESDSGTATTQPGITTSAIAKGDIITVDIDQVGATLAGKAVSVALTITR